MLVQPQPQATEEEEEVELPTAPPPPSPTTAPSLVPQDPIPTPPQTQPVTPHASPSSPPQVQPTTTAKSTLSLLTTLMDTCATLSNKLEKKRRSKSSGLRRLRKVGTSQRVESSNDTVVGAQEDASKQERGIKAIDADEDITLVDIETQVDMDVELQGRIDDDNAATKDANAAKPTVFDDEEVTMTMAQTLIKMKAEKAKLLDEQILKRKYQSLKRKPVSIAQARKNMIIYLMNMAGYKMEHFRGMTYDK
nr:hypothetical protein [Tanacetum cinerariifolium]